MMEQVAERSRSEIKDLKIARAEWELVPIIVTFFTPISVGYAAFFSPMFIVFFLFGRIELVNDVGRTLIRLVFNGFWTLLLLSVPALIVSIIASGMLHRLSNGKTSPERVLRAMIIVTIVWAIYYSIFFFGSLSVGQPVVGPVPLPFGPLVAVLVRGHIMRRSEEIAEA
jgi:hypothetical protein